MNQRDPFLAKILKTTELERQGFGIDVIGEDDAPLIVVPQPTPVKLYKKMPAPRPYRVVEPFRSGEQLTPERLNGIVYAVNELSVSVFGGIG